MDRSTAIACIHLGNDAVGYMAPEGYNRSTLSTPNMARGTSGSSTRTISRNIMPLKAMEPAMMRHNICKIDHGMKDNAQAGDERPDDGDRYSG